MIMKFLAARAACSRLRRTALAAVTAATGSLTPAMVLPAAAKLPGHQYCFHGTCHRVASIAETEDMIGRDLTLSASFYDDCKRDSYNPCGLTSSGEAFRPGQPDNAASPVFPDGTTLLLFNPRTRGAAVVRVNNAGPYWGKRTLDVSRAAAEKLGFRRSGVAELEVRVIKAPSKAEATYKKNRRYGRVPGFLGRYASLGEAHRGMATVMALEAMATSLLAPLTGSVVVAARDDVAAQRIADGGSGPRDVSPARSRSASGRLASAGAAASGGVGSSTEAQAKVSAGRSKALRHATTTRPGKRKAAGRPRQQQVEAGGKVKPAPVGDGASPRRAGAVARRSG